MSTAEEDSYNSILVG